MEVATQQLVGRDEELGAVLGLLDAPEQLPAAVLLRGDAGIGKTTMWLAGLDAAAVRGYRILTSRPSEAETRFSFAGLADLLAGSAGDVLPELPPIQQRALEAALLLGDSETHADDRAVAAAFLGALRALAADRPVCLAVDDLQWLDAASLAALRYALARLDEAPVAALLAVRGDAPEWVRRTVPEGRLHTLGVGGLSVGATQVLLRDRLGATFPRPTLIRIWETSAGNPFFALELAAALQRRGGTVAPGDELPIPADLGKLLDTRVDGLGAAGLAVARAAAALAEPTVPLVESAVGRRSDSGLAETLAARILELDGERIRFTHPLLRSAVAARVTPGRRRTLHARLAAIAPTAEERARHLALATPAPDADVAAALEEAARSALARGAPAAAAELAEQALRLTPASSGGDIGRRVLVSADMHSRAGDAVRATALLEQARDSAAPGRERAAVLSALALVQANIHDEIALHRDALAEAEGDDALQATTHLHLATLMRFEEGLEAGIEHAQLAVSAAARVGDPALRARALGNYALMQFNAGRGTSPAELDEALALERSLPEWPLPGGPTGVLGHQLVWMSDVDRARALFDEARSVESTRNEPRREVEALWYLSVTEWRAGNWELADRHAADVLDLEAQLGRMTIPDYLPPALIAAHRGRVDDARATAQAAIRRAEKEGINVAQASHSWVLGFLELSQGHADAALPYLRAAHDLNTGFIVEPAMRLELGDHLETLIAVGELEEAEEVLATWDARATALDRAWALAVLARCRGLLLASRGDFEAAFTSFERALSQHGRTTDPFQHARTLLALGKTQRRAKKRGAARATLEDALARFEALGAPLWADRTRDELARIGGRAPSRGELTEAERRIAELVAEGRTNREVAAALFLTDHSVETALTRIYRKLGVRSRAQLARVLSSNS